MSRTRKQMTTRAASELHDARYVNLGTGLPPLIPDVPDAVELMLHSETGILGVGTHPKAGHENHDLTKAGKEPVASQDGASCVDSATNLGKICGEEIDAVALGALQVSESKDIGNWVMADKVVRQCPPPLTGQRVVQRNVTDLAVIDVTEQELVLVEVAPGPIEAEARDKTEPDLLST